MWEILGIKPTTDIKAIKSAYARLAKQYNPEENPEEFRKIYDAYKEACNYASMSIYFSEQLMTSDMSDNAEEKIRITAQSKDEAQEEKSEFDFSALHFDRDYEILPPEVRYKDYNDMYRSTVSRMREIIRDQKNNISAWENFFGSEEFERLVFDKDFRITAGNAVFGLLFSPEAASIIAGSFSKGSKAVPVNYHPVQEWQVFISSAGNVNSPAAYRMPNYIKEQWRTEQKNKKFNIIFTVGLILFITLMIIVGFASGAAQS